MTQVCDDCGQIIGVGEWPWCPHGIPERPGGTAMIDDQVSGGPRLFENLGHEPVYVESKSQLRDEMRARGLQHRVEHRGVPGSDKSPVTQRWI
jgi:hypothetical protein